LEGTIGMAYSCLKEVSEKDADDGATKNQQAQSKKLRESELFKKTIATFEACKMTPSGPFPRHPKLDMAIELLASYFIQQRSDSDNEGVEGSPNKSKAMVFVTHREAVDELVGAFDTKQPIIRPSMFIGQGMDKHGKKGQSQKEQLEV